jgi:hypothetical protein
MHGKLTRWILKTMNGRSWHEFSQAGREQEHVVLGAKKAVDEDCVWSGCHLFSMVMAQTVRNTNVDSFKKRGLGFSQWL